MTRHDLRSTLKRLPWPNLVVLLGYLLLAVLMNLPMSIRLGTQVAGTGNDRWVYHWNNWWLRKALVEGRNPFRTSYMFYPHGVSLVWHGFSWYNTGVWIPLQALVGPLAAHNLTILLAYTVSGFSAYLLGHDLTGSRRVAFVAGLVFAYYPYHYIHRNQLNLLSVQWIPLFTLCLMRLTQQGRLRDGLTAGVTLALCGLCGAQVMILSVMWGGLWLLHSLITQRDCWSRRTVLGLALGGAVCAMVLAPCYGPMVAALLARPDIGPELTASQTGKATDLLAYFVPSFQHPLVNNGVLEDIYERWVNVRRVAAVGYTVLGLAVWAAVKQWRRARVWVVAALVFAVLALGSTLRVNGRAFPGFPMPYRLLAPTLVGAALRHPSRFNLILAMPIAGLTSIGLADLLRRLDRRRSWMTVSAAACIFSMILFEYIPPPFDTTEPIHSGFYDLLREDSDEYAIADFPIGYHAHDKWYMYAQTLHERPMIGGHVSRVPARAHDFIDSVPLLTIARKSAPRDGELDDVSRQLAPLVGADVKYVIVHRDRASSSRVSAWREWFAVPPHYEDEHLVVFRTAPSYGRHFEFMEEIGDGIGVIKAELSQDVLPQQGLLEVEVVWGTRKAPSTDWRAYLALVGSGGQEVQRADFEPCSGWATSTWGEDALARGRGQLQIDPYVTGGTYAVGLGLMEQGTGREVGKPILIGEVDVQAIPRTFEIPDMAVESDVTFGTALKLLGYDLRKEADQVTLKLHWQALRRMETPYKFFVHLVDDETGNLVAQADFVPYDWTYHTTWWEAGEVVSDEVVLSVADVPRTSCRVEIGVYRDGSGERLLLTDGAEPQQPSDRYVLPEAVEIR